MLTDIKNEYTKEDIDKMLNELDSMLKAKSQKVLNQLHKSISNAFDTATEDIQKIRASKIIKAEDEKHDHR